LPVSDGSAAKQAATPAKPAWPRSGIASDAYAPILMVGAASGASAIVVRRWDET
jgi:hypothetical protein